MLKQSGPLPSSKDAAAFISGIGFHAKLAVALRASRLYNFLHQGKKGISMPYSFSRKAIPDFLSLLSSDQPVPGGGGASALVGAVGISLGSMVGALTCRNPKYDEVKPEITDLINQAENIRLQLCMCIDADAEAFEPLSRAYRLPKDAPGRDAIMEDCLKTAASVPLRILHLCADSIDLQKRFAETGARIAVSDAATGIAFCLSALEGAAVNVLVNTKYMKNREYADQINAEVETVRSACRQKAESVYSSVYEGLLK